MVHGVAKQQAQQQLNNNNKQQQAQKWEPKGIELNSFVKRILIVELHFY